MRSHAMLPLALFFAAGCHSKSADDCIADLLTDPDNCGACAHSCSGSTCTNGFCDPVDVAKAQPDPSALSLVDGALVWSDRGDPDANGAAIARCPTTGCGASGPTVITSPSRIETFAVAGETLVWIDPRGAVSSCAISSCDTPKVVGLFSAGIGAPPAPFGSLSTIVADANGFVFGSIDPANGVVATCALGGCAPTNADATVIAHAQPDLSTLVIDATNAYWGTDGTLRSCARAGCAKPTDLASNQTRIGATLLEGTTLYWGTALATTPNHVRSIATSGGAVTEVALAERAVGGLAIDGDWIYWTEPDGGTLKRAKKDGSGDAAQVFVSNEKSPTAIVVADGWVYFLARGSDGAKFGDGAVRKVVTP